MNNQEFGKLLREWKQKNLQEELEEGVLNTLNAGVLAATMAAGLAASSPAMASPTEKPSATQQVQKKEQLKDFDGLLSDDQKYLIGVIVKSIDSSMSDAHLDAALDKFSVLRGLIDNEVKMDPQIEKRLQKIKTENPEGYKEFVEIGHKAIKDGIRYEIDNSVKGMKTLRKVDPTKEKGTEYSQNRTYGSARWDDLRNAKQRLEEKKRKKKEKRKVIAASV